MAQIIRPSENARIKERPMDLNKAIKPNPLTRGGRIFGNHPSVTSNAPEKD